MDRYLFNYLCLSRWIGLKSQQRDALLRYFRKVESIQWREVTKMKSNFGIPCNLVMPYEAIQCRFLRKYHEFMSELKEQQIHYHSPTHKGFPNAFRLCDPASHLIFTKGEVSLLSAGYKVAIVGSRKPTPYGKRVAYELATLLAKRGICVISGMALGIDAIVHKATIDAKGQTIAILASGIQNPYPKTHSYLYEEILLKKGLIISEKEGFDTPLKYEFPLRNRLISALADVVVVIEAAEKSGSLTTAYHAMEQGKNLFALPGTIFSANSKGCNQLISEGAYPLIDYQDVLVGLGIPLKAEKNQTEIPLPSVLKTLSPLSQKVYTLLLDVEKVSIESVKNAEKCEDSQVLAAFSELVLEELCVYISLNEIEIK